MSKPKRSRARSERSQVVDAAQVVTPDDPPDPEVKREFDDAQRIGSAGGRQLATKLAEHHSQSPALSAGDIDAAWDHSDAGEETAGGSVPTPDQGVVEEIGEALGLTFEDNEPVDAPGKLRRRDRHRWELEPASSEDFRARQEPQAVPGGGAKK